MNLKNNFLSIIVKSLILIIIIIIMCCLSSCFNNKNNYTYKWKLSVVYTNGDKDTIDCEYDSFNGNDCYLTLKISESGLLTSGGTEPCIITGCGFYWKPVVCGVRKYEIISLEKILLEK